MEGKWAFLYLIVVVVLTLSYSADLRIIKLPSVALPVIASSNRGGLGFRHAQIAKLWVSQSAQKRDRLLDYSLE
jgi:hypothetical protein